MLYRSFCEYTSMVADTSAVTVLRANLKTLHVWSIRGGSPTPHRYTGTQTGRKITYLYLYTAPFYVCQVIIKRRANQKINQKMQKCYMHTCASFEIRVVLSTASPFGRINLEPSQGTASKHRSPHSVRVRVRVRGVGFRRHGQKSPYKCTW